MTDSTPSNAHRRILIIDDNRAIHDDFRKILGPSDAGTSALDAAEARLFGAPQKVSFEIDAASQGQEGLKMVKQALAEGRPYSMAFVDVRMPPGWDGIETTGHIWEVCPDLQVVICTAYADCSWDEVQEQIKPGDRMLILKKPFDTIEVLQLANALTEKWRLLQKSKLQLDDLEQRVQKRTLELEESRTAALTQARLLDLAHDAIIVRDMLGHVQFWNAGAQQLYGWTADEICGQDIQALGVVDAEQFAASMEQLMLKGSWTGELKQAHKDGHPIAVDCRWTLVRDDAGQPKCVLVINTDITEKKKIQEQFLRSQRMESIGTLASGIAHDLNNALTPIMMSIELLKLNEQDKGRLLVLTTIEGGAKRGAEMVRQVLSFARGMEGQRLEVQAGHLLKEIEKTANETFLKSIQVRSNIPADLWTIRGDPTQLHQVLLNLSLNARDAMPQGGTLTFTASNIRLDERYASLNSEAKPGPYVVIHVEDTGTGMTPDVMDHIFEPFFTTKELGKGTGLGLSTSQAITKGHGGFIHVYSEVGKGTAFRLYLPAQTVSAPAEAIPEPIQLPRGNGELVMVVDDEADVRQITGQTLEAFGYRTLLAYDGVNATALYAIQKDEVSVVLTDMMMPLMDGPATIRVLTQMNPQVRIIAASGLTANGALAKASSTGVRQFLPKPYTAESILQALHTVLQN